MSEEHKTIVIKGKSYYACVRAPNELSGKYQMDLGNLTAQLVENLTTIGVEVKNKNDERENFVTLKSSVESKEGKKFRPPQIVDSEKNEIPEDVLIGNGSTVKVVTTPFDWKFKGKTGVGLGIGVIQVLDLVPYTPKNMALLDEEE